ncbi:hypothetical protein KP509_01G100500 [Ceratopteris richardii]|nr:hypothetical protein KP509_01G100500 [Ceratopteris richardii]
MAIPADAPGLHVPSPSQAVQANINASEDEDTAKTEHYMQQQAGVRHDVQQKDSRLESDDDADAAPLRKGDAEENAQLLEALKLSSAEVVSDSEKKPEESLDQMNLVGSVNSEPSISTSAIEYGNHGVKNGKEDWYLVPPENNLKASEDNSRSSGTIECTKLVPDIRNNVKDDEDSKDIERDLDLKASTTEDESTKSSLEKDEAPAVELQERIPPLEALADSVKSQGDADKNALSDQNINVVQDDLVDHINLASAMRSSEKNSDLSPSSSSLAENSEHLNEGETQMALTASTSEIREPLYDGETNPAECPGHIGIEEEGAIINNFLKNNATQLTYYGLFCLQEGLKERELCVFFRNNHFSTMFKYKGEIYMLMTDQGYMNQPDIVWEKLDEVHGDTVFVTGNFTEFQAGGSSSVWDEQGAIAATTNYLSSHQQPSRGVNESNFTNRDLELAMSLQHQELEQQQQARAARHSQVDSNVRADGSRLITGPKRSTYTQKPEAKSKCVVM